VVLLVSPLERALTPLQLEPAASAAVLQPQVEPEALPPALVWVVQPEPARSQVELAAEQPQVRLALAVQ
jgi:hypothetical protein